MTTITQMLDSLGTPPQTTDTANFDPRADTLFGTSLPLLITQQNTLSGQINTVAGEVNANAVAALASETAAAASALSAQIAGTSEKWVSGHTYAEGEGVWSPVNYLPYRRIVAGAGTTDPSADTTNWVKIGGKSAPKMIETSSYTVLSSDDYLVFAYFSSITITLPTGAAQTGRVINVKTISAVTVANNASIVKPLTSDTAGTAILAATAGKWAELVYNGSYWVIMAGN